MLRYVQTSLKGCYKINETPLERRGLSCALHQRIRQGWPTFFWSVPKSRTKNLAGHFFLLSTVTEFQFPTFFPPKQIFLTNCPSLFNQIHSEPGPSVTKNIQLLDFYQSVN